MIVLHGSMIENRFFLWGERNARETDQPLSKGRKAGKQAEVQIFPYDAGLEHLKEALRTAAMEMRLAKKSVEMLYVWLPSCGKVPLVSNRIIADLPSRGTWELAAWRITSVEISFSDVAFLLCRLMNADLAAPGILVGSDLRFWSNMMRFSGSLVARQQFLPDLVQENDSWRACWRPLILANAAQTFQQSARAMPPACRALTRDHEIAPDVSSAALLTAFLNRVVDFLVRFSRKRDSGRPAPAGLSKTASFDSLHDRWIHALWSEDGLLKEDGPELAQLAGQIREWQRPSAYTEESPFRLCFRLEEPVEGDSKGQDESAKGDTWYVRYLLQDTRDPSLLIPAENAWKPKGRESSLFKRRKFNPNEYLLFSLGRASRISRHIESSLRSSNPPGYELRTEQAYSFLTQEAVVLDQMGFGLLLPSWWVRKGVQPRFSASAHVKSPAMTGGGGLSMDDLVHFEWEIALGEEKISLKELEDLARLKTPLVKIRGQWVHLHPDDIAQALKFLQSASLSEGTVRDAIQLSLGRTPGPWELETGTVTAEGAIAALLDRLNGRAAFSELECPERFQGTLRPYQVRGYSWLGFLRRWGLGACLADDMGLGKTIQALALIQHDRHTNGKKPVLLVCPTSVMNNWEKEAARFTPDLPTMIHHGNARNKGNRFQHEAEKNALVISSYSLLYRDFEMFKSVSWSGIILDEAQNIKNADTKQSRAARALQAEYRIALTGTPVENNVGDLWSIMEFLNPGLLGKREEFKKKFFIPIQALRDQEAVLRLKRLTGPFVLRRLKTDRSIIADLPEKMEMKVFCNLTKEQASLYAAVVEDMESALDSAQGIERKGLILAVLSKLKQICNHPAQFLGDRSALPGRSGKLARLTEMLEEILAVGDRTLIFTQFAAMGTLLREYLQYQFGQEVLFLCGQVAKKSRDAMIERFQSENGPSIFVLSLKAGGTGLNLTRANHVFHFDRWWNPAVENQATDRAFRIGQTKNVQVHKFLCVGTMEERIDQMIESKKEIAEGVVGTGEGWLTELSTAELKDLFKLSRDAVAE